MGLYITDPPPYVANAEIDASFRSGEKSSWGSVRVGDMSSGQGLKIGDVVLPCTNVEINQEWDDELEVDYHTCANSQLEETMHNTGPVLTKTTQIRFLVSGCRVLSFLQMKNGVLYLSSPWKHVDCYFVTTRHELFEMPH